MNRIALKTTVLVPVAAVLFFVVLWLSYPHELKTGDPWVYSHNAYLINQATYFQHPPNHPFGHRLAVFVPVALIYELVGINSLTTHLWPLLAALIIMATIWYASSTIRSRYFALFFSIVSGALLVATVSLHPDIIAAAFMALSTLLLQKRKMTSESGSRYLLLPLAAASCLIIAFLAKLSVYWIIPLWIGVLVSDLRNRDFGLVKRFYIPFAVALAILMTGYLFLCNEVWGDPLARLLAVQKLTGGHLWSWENTSFSTWFERLTYAPAKLYLDQYGIVAILAVASIWLIPRNMRIWGYYTLCTVVVFWFGSTSLASYEPMPLVPRMTLPCLPGFCLLAGAAAARITESEVFRNTFRKVAAYCVLVAMPILPFSGQINYWQYIQPGETRAMEVVRSEVEAHIDRKYLLICSDSRSHTNLIFHFEYEYPENLTVIWAGDLNNELLNTNAVAFLYLHTNLSRWLDFAYGHKNYDKQMRSLSLPELSNSGRVLLWKCESPADLIGVFTDMNSKAN